ncbi:HAMP domain-containing sensor histidine kinase [Actinoplanes sp. NPDC048967]|uniref:sensor histidine kinase n=1 Tax=Actinoplanes sp. NPDC048967 TaxID=3155269 RepID=UPI0033DD2503
MSARRRLRTQLTLLYAVPFLASGAILLSIPILQSRESSPVGTGVGPPPVAPVPGPDLARVVTASAAGLAAMGLVALVLGWLIAGRFLRPLREITATARDISASNLHRRLGRTGRNDEFTELAATLDDLFARLEASFTAQRDFVANASHELRTPLTAQRALLQVALADPDVTVESLRAVGRDVLDLGAAQERLIDALLTLATGEQGVEHREPFDLADVAGAVVTGRQDEAQRRDLEVRVQLDTAPATGDRRLVESLVANLVDNALRHNTPGGSVELRTAAVDGRATLTVRNTGAVIPPAELDRLFQPFQRLGAQRLGHSGGHGLGLAIVRAIATAHGATLVPAAPPEGGLAIEVRFG